MLLIVALVLFAAAAAMGLIFAGVYLKQGNLSLGLAGIHGLFAASGLVVLLIAATQGKTSRAGNISLGIFVIAAIGGFVLLYNHLTKGKLPKPLIAAHAIAAVLAFVVLLLAGSRV